MKAEQEVKDLLVQASWAGSLDGVQASLAAGASVNCSGKDCDGNTRTPLHAAVGKGHAGLVADLLSLGADPNSGGVMYYAVRKDVPDTVQLLIDAGGSVNHHAPSGDPLLFAAIDLAGSERMVRVLLAQPSLRLDVKKDGHTPEAYALMKHKPKVASLIRAEVSTAVKVYPGRDMSAFPGFQQPSALISLPLLPRWCC